MRAGDIDFTYIFSSPGSFAATSGGKVFNWASPNDMGIFAMNVKQKPWSDVYVRRAVAYALNRTELVTANGGPASAQPGSTLIPMQELRLLGSKSRVNALLKSIPQYPFNLAKARQEMAQSAYPKGFTTTTDTRLRPVGRHLRGHRLRAPEDRHEDECEGTVLAGVDRAGLRAEDLFEHVHILGAGNPDPGGQPGTLLGSQNVKSGGGDLANYDPKSVDELIARGVAASIPTTRLAIYGELLKKLGTDVPYVPLFNLDEFIVLGSKFTFPASVRSGYETWVFDQWPFLIRQAA